MKEYLYTYDSAWVNSATLNTRLASYMPSGGGTFTGNVTMSGVFFYLGTNSLKFTTTDVRTLTPTILEALYTKYST